MALVNISDVEYAIKVLHLWQLEHVYASPPQCVYIHTQHTYCEGSRYQYQFSAQPLHCSKEKSVLSFSASRHLPPPPLLLEYDSLVSSLSTSIMNHTTIISPSYYPQPQSKKSSPSKLFFDPLFSFMDQQQKIEYHHHCHCRRRVVLGEVHHYKTFDSILPCVAFVFDTLT